MSQNLNSRQQSNMDAVPPSMTLAYARDGGSGNILGLYATYACANVNGSRSSLYCARGNVNLPRVLDFDWRLAFNLTDCQENRDCCS